MIFILVIAALCLLLFITIFLIRSFLDGEHAKVRKYVYHAGG